MPIFDFKCKNKKCTNKELIEMIIKINELTPTCPSCHEPMEKQVSAGSFILKGDGWYKPGAS